MKKIVFLSLVIALIIGSCTQQEVKSPVEGAWKIVSFNMPSMNMTFPGQVQGEQIKIWTKEYVAFVGQYKVDTTVTANYGWGTYTLNGNKYEEKVVLHADKPSIGRTIRILLDIRNDTLTQRYPADENWKLQEGYSTEKYVRVE